MNETPQRKFDRAAQLAEAGDLNRGRRGKEWKTRKWRVELSLPIGITALQLGVCHAPYINVGACKEHRGVAAGRVQPAPTETTAFNHHSPFTIHHSPFTIHHSPLTFHH